jgi:hypothetical protein
MSTATPAVQQILDVMSGKTVTLGWDVIVGYNADAVNELFAQQFVANVKANQTYGPISPTVKLTSTASVVLNDVYLGPPLISFVEAVGSQQAIVQMNFIAGSVLVLDQSGPVQYVTGYQTIVPGDQYALRMVVDLTQVHGGVTAGNAVVVNLQNASSFQANLVSGTAGGQYLGQYFQEFFQKETAGTLTYQLGGIAFGTSENLTPSSFEIRTQMKPGSADGAVMLFVATTYNREGGNLPGRTFPYLIPSGYGAVLVVQSSTLFGHVMPSFYATMPGSPRFETDVLQGSSPASFLKFTGGAASPGIVKGSWSSGGGILHQVWSGSPGDYLGGNPGYKPAVVPYNGLTIEPSDNALAVNWSASWSQQFTGWTFAARLGVQSASESDLTLSISNTSYSAVPSIDEGTDVISFSGTGGTPVVTFTKAHWFEHWFGNGNIRDEAGKTLAQAAAPVAKATLNLKLPQVDAFAVSHLLFPSSNVMQFTDVFVPGDLALFGNINLKQTAFMIAPLQATIGAGETQQFTASSGETLTWSINPRIGTISQSGLYTAPAAVPNAIPIVVTATDSKDDVITAIVTVVPHAIAVSPAFTMLFENEDPVTFSAATLGELGPVKWSISPNDGSAGTISDAGVYTPPASFSAVTGATITATAGAQSASAVVALMPYSMSIGVTPNFTTLGPGAQQQFTFPGAGSVTWNVLPQGAGSIDDDGLYTAPQSIQQNMTAYVVATAPSFGSSVAGGAVVALTPAHSR